MGWRLILEDRSVLYAHIGLRLLDDITGKPPLNPVEATLDVSDGQPGWRETDIQAVVTPSRVLIYPGLERRRETNGPPRRYRARLSAAKYVPLYRANADGIEFDAFPYNDTNPPQVVTQSPVDTYMLPAADYDYQTHISVIRGVVETNTGTRVPDALVREGLRERTLTNRDGAFSLAVRWVSPGVVTPIDASDRFGRVGSINITLPGALTQTQTIVVN